MKTNTYGMGKYGFVIVYKETPDQQNVYWFRTPEEREKERNYYGGNSVLSTKDVEYKN